MSRSRTIYYDHARGSDEQPAFPQGEAGSVIVESDGSWSSETEVQIGPNSHCALIHHGVADELTALPDARGHAGSGSRAGVLRGPATNQRWFDFRRRHFIL